MNENMHIYIYIYTYTYTYDESIKIIKHKQHFIFVAAQQNGQQMAKNSEDFVGDNDSKT